MEGKRKLRNIERIILSKLEINARAPFSKFRKSIKKSQQQVSYTVNTLKERGIIDGFYTLIDYSKFNVLQFRVYFKVSYINEKKLEELIDFLVREKHTAWVAACGGRYDLICTFFALNPSQFNKAIKSVVEKFSEQINNYTVLTTIVMRIFGRKYLLKKKEISSQIIGGDREPENMDGIDMALLNEIAEDARKNSVTVGNILELSPKTVINRIKALKDKKVIRGFKPLLNLRKVGYHSNILVIKYHNISSEIEDKLVAYLKIHPNVVSVIKTLGEWDLEIEMESEDETELRKVEREIRQKFALLIQEIETIPLYQNYKKNFFPRFLIE